MSKVFKMSVVGILLIFALAVSGRDSQAKDAVGCCTLTGDICSYSQQNCPQVSGVPNYCNIGMCS